MFTNREQATENTLRQTEKSLKRIKQFGINEWVKVLKPIRINKKKRMEKWFNWSVTHKWSHHCITFELDRKGLTKMAYGSFDLGIKHLGEWMEREKDREKKTGEQLPGFNQFPRPNRNKTRNNLNTGKDQKCGLVPEYNTRVKLKWAQTKQKNEIHCSSFIIIINNCKPSRSEWTQCYVNHHIQLAIIHTHT